MFAVAIWDSLTRSLVLARDPLGIKPLYLTEQQGGIAFASEIRALRVPSGP
jgi:asparagine synthase (glutamine-hydrolysing)